jgi:hypothetical protein
LPGGKTKTGNTFALPVLYKVNQDLDYLVAGVVSTPFLPTTTPLPELLFTAAPFLVAAAPPPFELLIAAPFLFMAVPPPFEPFAATPFLSAFAPLVVVVCALVNAIEHTTIIAIAKNFMFIALV